MIPKRVVLENFLSFGTPATEIAFSDDEPLWVLSGPNGVGKSAVFDAITYALFGCHRGGKGQGMDELVRHGANGFKVIFDFEANGTDYRITRTHRLVGRPTQKVESSALGMGNWQAVAGALSPANLKGWAEQTLGLGFEAFTASVLLRQGQADEIITATGTRRLEILKKIINTERYEALSIRVHDATKQCKNRFDDLRTRRDGLMPVSDVEVQTARDEFDKAETRRTEAHQQVANAVDRWNAAKLWVKLESERDKWDRLIRSADERAAHADRIRTDKARLDELTNTIPILWQLVQLRDRLAKTEEALDKQKDERTQLTEDRDRLASAVEQEKKKAEAHRLTAEHHGREAQRLNEEIDRETKFVDTADGVATLKAELKNDFPLDLSDQLVAARSRVTTATDAASTAGNKKAEASGLLKQAKAKQKAFANVAIGIPCSTCGQPVTEKHAEDERARLATDVQEFQSRILNAEQDERTATTAKNTAEAEKERLEDLANRRKTTETLLAERERILAGLGVTADPAELRARLDEKKRDVNHHVAVAKGEAEKRDAANKEAIRLDTAKQTQETKLAQTEKQVREAEQKLATDQGQQSTWFGQLSAEWQATANTLNAAGVVLFDAEQRRLNETGVADQMRQLEIDATRRGEWAGQLAGVNQQIETIPVDARVPVLDADKKLGTLREDATKADAVRDEAKENADDIGRRAEEFRQLVEQVAAAETHHNRHRILDDLLGKYGLQRELVRDAEQQIVYFANDTVQKLSDGDLTIELDDGSDSNDEAFALQVRRADHPNPIGVNYLSGSQKFRVAVSVALAIGRYAADQSRRLESVIIDEGFGSLDKEGLRATADELNRLRQHLRRIVLVSHQEEFAERFPVVIQLSCGENGTVAKAVRR